MQKVFSGKRVLAVTIVLGLTFGMTLFASASNHEYQSKGNVEYQSQSGGSATTLFAVDDIMYLDEKIDGIETSVLAGKGALANKLNLLGTNSGLSESSTFEALATGVDKSQTLPSKTVSELLTDAGLTASEVISDAAASGSSITGSETIEPITAENITLGKAGYVDGELVVGTGGDNNNYYSKGYTEGTADALNSVNIEYTYHTHTGSSSSGGGCYTVPVYKTTTQSVVCGTWVMTLNATLGDGTSHWRCSGCGAVTYQSGNNAPAGGTHYKEVTVNTSTVDHWNLGCGKTEETVESAIIKF